jgi:enterochelin esterase-like enzyme
MVDSGLRDDWFGRAKDLHTALEAQGIQHRWWTPDGAHDGFYWFYNATEYLTWYDSILPVPR